MATRPEVFNRPEDDSDRAEAVARYLLHLSLDEPESEPITQMRLQKLLYYAQAWGLVSSGGKRSLFENPIEAWPHGPVVSSVYQAFKGYSKNPIDPHEASNPPSLSREDRAIVQWVWSHYKQFSAVALREMTHRHAPYERAWQRRESGGSNTIPTEEIADFFASKYDALVPEGLKFSDIREANLDYERGNMAPLGEVMDRYRDAI